MASPLSATAAEIEAAMVALLAPSGAGGAGVAAAEASLRAFLATPSSSQGLVAVLQASSQEGARQMAALLLRRKVSSLWTRCDGAGRSALQALLLGRLACEPSRGVRKALIGCVASLARVLLPGGGWPDALALLAASLRDSSGEVRELGMMLLLELAEAVGVNIVESLPPRDVLRPVLLSGLTDAEPRVRMAALRSVGAVLTALEDDGDAHAELVDVLSPLLAVTQQALGMGGGSGGIDEDAAMCVLETLSELVTCGSPIVCAAPDTLASLFCGMLSIMAAEHLELSTRAAAGDLLSSILEARPRYVVRRGLLPILLPALLRLAAVHDAEGDAQREAEAAAAGLEAEGDSIDAIDAIATRVLNVASMSIASRALFAPLMGLLQAAARSPVASERRAAALLFGVASEGLAETLQRNMDAVLAFLLPLVTDADVSVREAAGLALSYVCDKTQPRVLRAHATIMPAVFALLRDPSRSVARRGCWAAEVLLAALDADAAVLYLNPVMAELGTLLSVPSLDVRMQNSIFAAVSSIAVSVGPHFVPHLPGVASVLLAMLRVTDEKGLVLRAGAGDCLGHIATAVGAAFEPFADEALAGALAGLEVDSLECRQSSFTLLACLAAANGAAPRLLTVLPHVLPMCLAVACSDEGITVTRSSKAEGGGAGASAIESLVHGDEDLDDDNEAGDSDEDDSVAAGQAVSLRVRSSAVDMQVEAINCLGSILGHCPAEGAISVHINEATELLETLTDHFSRDIKGAAWVAMQGLIKAFVRLAPPLPPPHAGAPAPPLPESWAPVYASLLTRLLTRVRAEPEREGLAKAIITLQEWLTILGEPGVAGHLRAIVRALQRILDGKALCQQDVEDEEGGGGEGGGESESEEEEGEGVEGAAVGGVAGLSADAEGGDDEDGDDHDAVLLDPAADALAAAAHAAGAAFLPYLPPVLLSLSRFAAPHRSLGDHHLALSGFCELLKPPFGPLASASGALTHAVPSLILPTLLAGARSAHGEMQRNAAYGLGLLAETCPHLLAPHLASVLAVLQPLWSQRRGVDDSDWVVDNALGALSRVLSTFSPPLVDLSGALPELLSRLPIVRDHTEHAPVFACLTGLLMRRAPEAAAHAPAIRALCAYATGPGAETVGGGVPAGVVTAIRNALAAIG